MFQKILNSIYRIFKDYFFTPLTGGSPSNSCRFSPTCSKYCHQAVSEHGLVSGGILSFKRVLRCHPYSSHPHHDPVPKPKSN